jgi:hypothetical protein
MLEAGGWRLEAGGWKVMMMFVLSNKNSIFQAEI